MKSKKIIEAIHQHDIRELLENLELLKDFDNKKIICHFCKETISEDNFSTIFPENNKILFSCSKMECLINIVKKL